MVLLLRWWKTFALGFLSLTVIRFEKYSSPRDMEGHTNSGHGRTYESSHQMLLIRARLEGLVLHTNPDME
jgi:hypothetical protein